MKLLTWVVVLLVVLAAAYIMLTQSNSSEGDLGTYAYMCENGAEFTMTPTADMAFIRIAPIGNAPFPPGAVLREVQSSAGARYEEGDTVFVGAGEGVQLTVGETTVRCDPKPNSEMAPWNWGDAGTGL